MEIHFALRFVNKTFGSCSPDKVRFWDLINTVFVELRVKLRWGLAIVNLEGIDLVF